MRILIVEDHDETRALVARVLRAAGHDTLEASDLATARPLVAAGGLAAIVLDGMLPDGDGLDLCRQVRAAGSDIPILMLTARGDVDDRVRGLDAGADDYLRKPFAMAEVTARVRALLRRGPRVLSRPLELGPLTIDLARRRVTVEGRETFLTRREFAILEVLAARPGQAVSRAALLLSAWGDTGANLEASLEVLVGRLRRKLAPPGAESPITTHRGFGYSLDVP